MRIRFSHGDQSYQTDLSNPMDISIPLEAGDGTVNCFHAPYMDISPVVAGDFVGATQQGGVVNFMNVRFNPHGNGTHTECVGHISKETYTINQCLKEFWFMAVLISLYPEKRGGDHIITLERIREILPNNPGGVRACIIRTHPNDASKLQRKYSGGNPPYLQHQAIRHLNDLGIEHLLVDLPSVDREEDGGQLLGHKAFWDYPAAPQPHKTITEMVYVPDAIKDGAYVLNLQIASFEMDASPSKPVLYPLDKLNGL